jgi:hypothetical protein
MEVTWLVCRMSLKYEPGDRDYERLAAERLTSLGQGALKRTWDRENLPRES